jgi:hypothetical protein
VSDTTDCTSYSSVGETVNLTVTEPELMNPEPVRVMTDPPVLGTNCGAMDETDGGLKNVMFWPTVW